MEEEIYEQNDEENIKEQLEKVLGSLPESFSVLEEEVDVNIQMEYMEMAKKRQQDDDYAEFDLEEIEKNILSEEVKLDDIKKVIVDLAGLDTPEVFRFFEKIKTEVKEKNPELFGWIAMAYHENKTNLESSLLDQKPVFVSTGMGGKGNKIRYFAVFIAKQDHFTEAQLNLLKSEIEYTFNDYNAELEDFYNEGKYAKIVALIPIDVNLREIFVNIIQECNFTGGGFIDGNFILTNTKKMTNEEIEKFIEKAENDEEEFTNEIDLF